MLCCDSHAEEVFAGIKMAVRKDIGNDCLSLGTHLLDAHDVWVSICDDHSQIIGRSTIDEEIDRKDAEVGHESGRLSRIGTFSTDRPRRQGASVGFKEDNADRLVRTPFREHADKTRRETTYVIR